VLKLANFRYHGNRGRSEPNFSYSVLLPDPDNPTQNQKLRLYLTQNQSYGVFKILPLWQ